MTPEPPDPILRRWLAIFGGGLVALALIVLTGRFTGWAALGLVTRGEDLLSATHIHRLLQALLKLDTPAYRHHRLLTNERGERLAKRDGAEALAALRAAGQSPAGLRAKLGF